jgi:hypothetical protein
LVVRAEGEGRSNEKAMTSGKQEQRMWTCGGRILFGGRDVSR